MKEEKIYRVSIHEEITMTGTSKADVKRSIFSWPEHYLRPRIKQISVKEANAGLPSAQTPMTPMVDD